MAIEWQKFSDGSACARVGDVAIQITRRWAANHAGDWEATLSTREWEHTLCDPDRDGIKRKAEAYLADRADLARLRAVEAAARAVVEAHEGPRPGALSYVEQMRVALDALRAALAGKGGDRG